MTDETIMLDQPSQIEAYRLIATRNGLEIEIRHGPRNGLTRGMALASAQRILAQYQVPGGPWRTRKKALKAMRQLCKQLGFQPSRQEQQQQKEAAS